MKTSSALLCLCAFLAVVYAATAECPEGLNGTVCSGNGVCATYEDGKGDDELENVTSCYCRPGYHGPACGRRTCDPPCGAHGVCTMPRWTPGTPRNMPGVCKCDRGWGGVQCHVEVCPGTSPDFKTQCTNGQGKCLRGPVIEHNGTVRQKLVCYCQPGYYGEACEIGACDPTKNPACADELKPDPSPPVTPGEQPAPNDTACEEDTYWNGTACTAKLHPPAPDPVPTATHCREIVPGKTIPTATCNGRGTCFAEPVRHGEASEYTCMHCEKGWKGRFCQTRDCGCENGGTCNITDGTCSCTSSFFGDRCEKQHCLAQPLKSEMSKKCFDHGTCNHQTGQCVCKTGYRSADGCEQSIGCNADDTSEDQTCFNGHCHNQKCVCDWKYRTKPGNEKHCVDTWCPDNCNFGSGTNPQGVCKMNGNSTQNVGGCECNEGWVGEACEKAVEAPADIGSACDQDCSSECLEDFKDKCEMNFKFFTMKWDAEKSASVRQDVESSSEQRRPTLEDLRINKVDWTELPPRPLDNVTETKASQHCFLTCVVECLSPCQKELASMEQRERDEQISKRSLQQPNGLPSLLKMTGHLTLDEQSDEVNREKYPTRVLFNENVTRLNNERVQSAENEMMAGSQQQTQSGSNSEAPVSGTSVGAASVGASIVDLDRGQQQPSFKALDSRIVRGDEDRGEVEATEARLLGEVGGWFP